MGSQSLTRLSDWTESSEDRGRGGLPGGKGREPPPHWVGGKGGVPSSWVGVTQERPAGGRVGVTQERLAGGQPAPTTRSVNCGAQETLPQNDLLCLNHFNHYFFELLKWWVLNTAPNRESTTGVFLGTRTKLWRQQGGPAAWCLAPRVTSPPGYGQFTPLSVLPNICKVVRMHHLIYIQSWKGNSFRKFNPLLKREQTSADLIFKTDLF